MAEPTGEISPYIKRPDSTNLPEKKDFLKDLMQSTHDLLDKLRAGVSEHTHPHSENVGQKPAGTPIEGAVTTSTATLGTETGLSAGGQSLPNVLAPTPPPVPNNLP